MNLFPVADPVPIYTQVPRHRPLLTRPHWRPWSRSVAVLLTGVALFGLGFWLGVEYATDTPLLGWPLTLGIVFSATVLLEGILLALIIDWEMPL